MPIVPLPVLRKRFWQKVSKGEPQECWLWTGTKSREKSPYGSICVAIVGGRRRYVVAHRVSWLLHKGEIPKGLKVLHECDTPLCVNPSHLFCGTQLDNVRDCIAKGRRWTARGALHTKAKLTDDIVRFIRASTMTGVALAKQFQVSTAIISCVRRRATWKHI